MKSSKKQHSTTRKTVKKKQARSRNTRLEQKLEMINPNAAGVDVASADMWVCVPEDRAAQPIRRFGAFTCDLTAIADWLTACCHHHDYSQTTLFPTE